MQSAHCVLHFVPEGPTDQILVFDADPDMFFTFGRYVTRTMISILYRWVVGGEHEHATPCRWPGVFGHQRPATRFFAAHGSVEMGTQREAKKAIAELNSTEFQGRSLKVNLAKPQEDQPCDGGSQNRW